MIVVTAENGASANAEAVCADIAELVQEGEQVVVMHNSPHKAVSQLRQMGVTATDLSKVDETQLGLLLSAGCVPVIAPPTDNGDPSATEIGSALKAQTVVILSDAPGLLRDTADESTLVSHIPLVHIHGYLARYALGPMKGKILGAMQALNGGVNKVILADGRVAQPVHHALAGQGTVITSNDWSAPSQS